MSCLSHINSNCATFRIANASPMTPSRRSSLANGKEAITAEGIVSQYRGGVHLLFRQIQLARADVLVRVELDFLEAHHARHDVDFPVRSNRRRLKPVRRPGQANVSRMVTFV